MSYASDKLYNGYLRVKMPVIVTRVKPRDIMMYLPCLTAHDREEIEAKTETRGSFNGMTLLLECLKRRENWPDQFIEALEACEHRALAAEVRAEYNALKRGNNSTPSSPPTTVITAHVHPAPPASHLSGPESGADSAAAAAAPPAEAPPAPPEPAPQAPPPLETPESKPPKAVSSPEPVPEPPQSTQVEVPSPPSTPPPSPETPHLLWATAADPQPQKQTNPHQEPEENSESDTQDVPVDAGPIPDQVSSGDDEVSVDPAPPPHRPVEQCETEAPPCTDTATVTSESTSPRSPPPSAVDSDVSSFPTMIPVKPPVQDTMSPVDKVATAVQQPEVTSEPPATQVVESIPQTETAAPPRPEPAAAAAAAAADELDTSVNDDNNLCLSKPGQLISIQPQDHASPTLPALCSMVAPYSGTSDRLEISVAAADSVTSACSDVTSAVADTVTTPPCRENGIAADHNEPEENQYDSPCQSLDEVVENVVHFSEEPSALNLGGQTSPSHGLIVNGEVAKETAFAPPPSTGDAASSESDPPPEAAAADVSLQNSGEKTTAVAQSVNTKYLLTAAGVGACALLMAWRWKH
ncbi:mitochondrial antiviral-signaling protein [Brachyistius frenatus]|uniref:mitochondrial antiviral-signaling protein n=1 Tax=Brachyistius frenatus TaxID=100188 RepID=UPI0037E73078